MRIISKFRDYYDAVMKSGMDREVVYVRETKDVDSEESYGVNFDTGSVSNRYTMRLIFLGYCGQMFKVYEVEYELANHEKFNRVFYNFSEFRDFVLEKGFGDKWEFGFRKWWPGKYNKFYDFNPNKMVEIFHKYQVPLFTLAHETRYAARGITTITLNPSLRKLDFHKIKDTYTAYQDIFQYVAGVLNKPENKMVKISDKDKIHKHGFDKWSFRQKGPKK